MNETILTTPATTIELIPELAVAAPTNPPTRVCDELDGNPHHHVAKFHPIAATSAAAITVRFITSELITPVPMVVATLRGKIRKATKLKVAANKTAEKGDNTFVDTIVAIELAESWNPLIKSNIITNPTTIYNKVILSMYVRLGIYFERYVHDEMINNSFLFFIDNFIISQSIK